MNEDVEQWVDNYLDDLLTPEETRLLAARVKTDPVLRVYFRERVQDHVLLREIAVVEAFSRTEQENVISLRSKSDKLGRFAQLGIAACLAAVAVASILLANWHRPSPIATLVAVEGEVLLLRNHQESQPRAGDLLWPGNELRIMANSRASVRYSDTTHVDLAANSKVTLQPLGHAPATGKYLNLHQGELSASVARQPEGRPMLCVTPDALATVIGTRLSLRVAEGKTTLTVTEGKVRFQRSSDRSEEDVVAGGIAEAPAESKQPTIASQIPIGMKIALEESFDDSDFSARGWYGDSQFALTSATQAPGSKQAAEYHFLPGSQKPISAATARRLFPETERVYLSYWVRYGSDPLNGDQGEIILLTNQSYKWSSPTQTPLSVSIRQSGGTHYVLIQDAANIDRKRIGQNLVHLTEERAVGGGNGDSDGYGEGYCSPDGSWNGKAWKPAGKISSGPQTDDWHHIAVEIQLNSIAGKIARADGHIKIWEDDILALDCPNVMLRTARNAGMRFNQLLLSPYVEESVAAEYRFWLDSLTLAIAEQGANAPSSIDKPRE